MDELVVRLVPPTLSGPKHGWRFIALDITKRLLDYNQHAPTIYFPLLVPECFLIEPTETETKEAMDDFIDAMAKILEEANTNPETVTEAPFTQPVRRLDEVKAAKELDLVWSEN